MPVFSQDVPADTRETSSEQTALLGSDESALFLDAAESEGERVVPASSGLWPLIRALLVLVLLVAIIWLLLAFIKRRNAANAATNPHLKLYASLGLALNKHVHVVGLGQKAWLIGSSENSVQLIAEIDDQELIDQMRLEASHRTALDSNLPLSFLRLFSRYTGRRATENSAEESLEKMKNRLKDI